MEKFQNSDLKGCMIILTRVVHANFGENQWKWPKWCIVHQTKHVFSMPTKAIPSKLLHGHSFLTLYPSGKFCPNWSSFHGGICTNV